MLPASRQKGGHPLWQTMQGFLNDADVSFRSVSEASEYMERASYDPEDFIYTDTSGGKECVYIKKDGVVLPYLMEGYEKEKLAEVQPPPQKGR